MITQKISMKKLIFVVIFFLFTILSRAEGFGFCFGGKLGYQDTKLSAAKANIDSDLANHMIIGAFGRVVLKNFVIQPEIHLFKSAQILDFNGTDATHLNISVEAKQQSLAIPLMLGYQVLDRPLVKVKATAGLVMYYVVDQTNQVVDQTNPNRNNSPSINVEPNTRSWGYAFNVGADFMMFTIDVSYSFGLTNLVERDFVEIDGQNFVMDNTRQDFITVTLGIKLFSYEYKE